ncbi:MAG: type II toxin-antitoxin system HicB family antitoxin [Methanomicrobia archaeon]|jgi:predicted RNase H-like HicB family nuclease|nr:type II toxin-antitoxin system HicB family antitoxin [Methanomicrobia archaeon]
MKKFNLTATIWEEEGVYVSKCPELGVASCGDTPEEALSNLKEAVELYLDNARELGLIVELETALTSSHKFTSTFEVTA